MTRHKKPNDPWEHQSLALTKLPFQKNVVQQLTSLLDSFRCVATFKSPSPVLERTNYTHAHTPKISIFGPLSHCSIVWDPDLLAWNFGNRFCVRQQPKDESAFVSQTSWSKKIKRRSWAFAFKKSERAKLSLPKTKTVFLSPTIAPT